MKHDDWLEVITRLPIGEILDLDEIHGVRQPQSSKPRFSRHEHGVLMPSGRLWPIEGKEMAFFGVRVREAPDDLRAPAARLAAAAIERHTAPVILSHIDRCGFERLGFRVERILGGTEAEIEAQENEIIRFWDMSIVVDYDDVVRLK